MIRFEQTTVHDPSGGAPLLHAWDVQISRGERVLLGGGRAEARAAAFGLLHGERRPDAGAVHLDGVEISALDRDGVQRLRRVVATWSHAPRLLPDASLLDNVALPLRFLSLPPARQRARALAAVEDAGLGEHAHRRVGLLAPLHQRLTEAARAAASGAEVLLADAPWLGLDEDDCAAVRDALHAAWLRGVTVLIAAADPAPLLGARPRLLRLLPDGGLLDEQPGRGPALAALAAL